MAKIAKPKKREASVHSRAYRRNATPPKEIASSTKSTTNENEYWMHNAQNAGVHKKTKTKKSATRQQHVRHLKALEKADRNSAVLESKVAKSKLRGKKIQARAKDWDELNEELTVKSNGTHTAERAVKDGPVEMDGIEEQPSEETPVAEKSDPTPVAEDHGTSVEASDQDPQHNNVADEELDVIT